MHEQDSAWRAPGGAGFAEVKPADQTLRAPDTAERPVAPAHYYAPVGPTPAGPPPGSVPPSSAPPVTGAPASPPPYPGAPLSPGAASAPPYSGAPLSPGAASAPPFQTHQFPAAPYPPRFPGPPPGGGQPPAWPGSPATHGPSGPTGSGRGGRIAMLTAGAVALALFSGAVGGLVVHQATGDGSQPVSVVTRNAAPQIDRNSVAGVADAVLPSVVDITTGRGEGSGVIYTSDGTIITNNHVVEGASGQLNVTFSNGKTAKATIVGTDPAGDLAVIKAQGVSGLTAAKFGDSDDMRVGDTVLAIGSPLGLQGSVSMGIISALHRTITEGADEAGGTTRSIGDALQTDAAINPGNSGGALVNLAGEVIGINTAIATASNGGQGSSGNIGVGFAISSNRVKSAADQLIKGGKVSHPYLGVRLSDADGGALIADVVAGGPAEKGGLQKGDLITAADSTQVKDGNDLINAIQSHKAGDKIQLTVQRNGSAVKVTVTLGEAP